MEVSLNSPERASAFIIRSRVRVTVSNNSNFKQGMAIVQCEVSNADCAKSSKAEISSTSTGDFSSVAMRNRNTTGIQQWDSPGHVHVSLSQTSALKLVMLVGMDMVHLQLRWDRQGSWNSNSHNRQNNNAHSREPGPGWAAEFAVVASAWIPSRFRVALKVWLSIVLSTSRR